MKAILSVALLCSVSVGFAQQKDNPDFKKKEPRNVKATSAPVTHAEAKATFDKAWAALAKGLKFKGTNPVRLASDAKAVTKDEVLAAIKAMVGQVQPYFKRSASPVAFSSNRFRKDLDQKAYAKLVKDGFVMPVGPLVVGKNGTLTTAEFGDAVGVMIVRIADLAHLPMRKYTPALMKND